MANLYGYNTSTARKLDNTDAIHGQNLHKELHNITHTNTISINIKNVMKKQKKKGFLITLYQ